MMTRQEPWDLFRAIARDFDRFPSWDVGAPPPARAWSPAVDIDETEDAYVLRFEVPGVRREDLLVEYQNGVLTVAGQRNAQRSEGQRLRSELFRGSFARSFALRGVDTNAIDATYADGVLTVRCPKLAQARPRKVEVRAAGPTLDAQPAAPQMTDNAPAK